MTLAAEEYPIRFGVSIYLVSITLIVIVACFFPGVSVGNVVSLAVVIGMAVFGVCFTPLSSRAAVGVLAVAATLLSVGIVLNTWYFTTYSGGTPEAPVLVNLDASRTWNDALWHLGDSAGEAAPTEHGLFGAVTAIWMAIFGRTITVAIIPGMVALLATLVLVGMTAMRLGHERRVAVTAMGAAAAVCYWLASGMILIKDPYVILAATMAGYAMTGFRRVSALWFIGAVALLALVRPNYIMILVVGLAIVPGRNNSAGRRIALAAVAAALWLVPVLMQLTPRADLVIAAHEATFVRYDDQRYAVINSVIGNFMELAWYTKLMLMPVWAAVQFLIPFPWTFMRDVPFGLSQVWAHITYAWYVFGGVLLYYLVGCVRSRCGMNVTLRLTLWGVFCWLVPCYLNGGMISRYGLPAVALMAPAVGATLVASIRSCRFLSAMTLWALLIAVALITCYYLQNQAA